MLRSAGHLEKWSCTHHRKYLLRMQSFQSDLAPTYQVLPFLKISNFRAGAMVLLLNLELRSTRTGTTYSSLTPHAVSQDSSSSYLSSASLLISSVVVIAGRI